MPATNFVNGRCAISRSELPLYNGYYIDCVAVASNGLPGPMSYVSQVFDNDFWDVVPFLDGTEQLKENLAFQLETADEVGPFGFYVNAGEPFLGPSPFKIQSFTNYAFADFHFIAAPNDPTNNAALINEFKPFEDNYFFRNFLYSPNGLNSKWFAGIRHYQ